MKLEFPALGNRRLKSYEGIIRLLRYTNNIPLKAIRWSGDEVRQEHHNKIHAHNLKSDNNK